MTSRRRSASAARAALCGVLALSAVAPATSGAAATPIVVSAGGHRFAAVVEDSETGRAFLAMLALTLDMSELNGNEKYRYGASFASKPPSTETKGIP